MLKAGGAYNYLCSFWVKMTHLKEQTAVTDLNKIKSKTTRKSEARYL
jgi:hypothetical protein